MTESKQHDRKQATVRRAAGVRRLPPAEQELIEAITHLAFYAGWPKAYAAMTVAKQVLQAG